MRTKLLLVLMFVTATALSQEFSIYLLTPTGIRGTAKPGSTIYIDYDGDGFEDESTLVDKLGDFKLKFDQPKILASIGAGLANGNKIWVWNVENKRNLILQAYTITNPAQIVEVGKQFVIPSAEVFKNKTTYTNATILTTNFNIPVARFNIVKHDNRTDAIGNINLFTSIGAGVGVNWGEKKTIYDSNGDIVNEDFKNYFGLNAGFLFSAQTGDDKKNVFAPTVNLTALDFQIGAGYELGSLESGQSNFFLTFSYAIPLYKLTKTGFLTLRERKKQSQKYAEVSTAQINAANDSIAKERKKADDSANKLRAIQDEVKSLQQIINTQLAKIKSSDEQNELKKTIDTLKAKLAEQEQLLKTQEEDLKNSIKTVSPEVLLKQQNPDLNNSKSSFSTP